MMDLVEDMYEDGGQERLRHVLIVPYQGEQIDLGGDWARMTMIEAVKKYSGVDYDDWADRRGRHRRLRRRTGVELPEVPYEGRNAWPSSSTHSSRKS